MQRNDWQNFQEMDQVNPLLEEVPGAYVNKNKITRVLSTAYREWKPFKELSITFKFRHY